MKTEYYDSSYAPLVPQVLLRAAALIEQGHCKHAVATDNDGRVTWFGSKIATNFCLSGGISRAAMDIARDERLIVGHIVLADLARTAVEESLGGTIPATKWNDRPWRTRRGVVKKLRNTAVTYMASLVRHQRTAEDMQ